MLLLLIEHFRSISAAPYSDGLVVRTSNVGFSSPSIQGLDPSSAKLDMNLTAKFDTVRLSFQISLEANQVSSLSMTG